MQYKRVSLQEALALRKALDDYVDAIGKAIETGNFDSALPFSSTYQPSGQYEKSILWARGATKETPQVRYRQAGDDYLLVEYGNEQFDLNYRCRTTALEKALHSSDAPTWLKENLTTTVSACTSINICMSVQTSAIERLLTETFRLRRRQTTS